MAISSSWGNGHATLLRGLARALVKRENKLIFFEKDTPYYRTNRDYFGEKDIEVNIYSSWETIKEKVSMIVDSSDVALVTSYCPDGHEASNCVINSHCKVKLFYDLDTPVTINTVLNGTIPFYLPMHGLSEFDAVLSYTGGTALEIQKTLFHAKKTFPLYGSVDPSIHYPRPSTSEYVLSYLGTYSTDRHLSFSRLFLEPAKRLSHLKFLLGGSQYPSIMDWPQNISCIEHISPQKHPDFYSSGLFTLNITRSVMAEMGYCPSGRLFEAAACEVPIISDYWIGLEDFFDCSNEIIIVDSTHSAIDKLGMQLDKRQKIAKAAKERVLLYHTCEKRADDFINILALI
jgi:spore maturation protein CgeB